MRLLMVISVSAFLAAGAFGQGRGRGRAVTPLGGTEFRTYGSRTGFGNILFPGMGNAPSNPSNINMIPNTAAAQQRMWYGAARHGGAAYPAVIPYPVFVGGFGYGYDPNAAADSAAPAQAYQQPSPNVVVVYPPPAQAAAPPETARPQVQKYGPNDCGKLPPNSNARIIEPGAPADDQPIFLIGLKDSSVYAASAYWVEGETLHYITPQGRHNQVSLDLVDRDVSEKLNRGRSVEFRLPPAK